MENKNIPRIVSNNVITAPKGFTAAGVSAGIKKNDALDIAVIYSEKKASAAGIFTLNKVRGHSLELCKNNLSNGTAQCVFINSGNANACVGPSGYSDALKIADICSTSLNINSTDVLTGSTGVIGHPLPMQKVLSGAKKACESLSKDGGLNASKAIMTTDTFEKQAAFSYISENKTITIAGIAKGSGMIHPNMATMIAVITTDANISSRLLKKLLKISADKSFNRISVDGDTSVCDKVLVLANGLSDTNEILPDTKEAHIFLDALEKISITLAKMIASDGEGATKLIEINIKNAKTADDAHRAAKAIANSPLVKTAFYGEDANWGRILTAAGYSGANLNLKTTSITIGSMLLFEKGIAIPFDENEAKTILMANDITITVDFGIGSHDTSVWTCDLSHKYIDINANYRT